MRQNMTDVEAEVWLSSRFQSEYLAIAKMKTEMNVHRALIEQNSAENQELLILLRKIKFIISILGGIEKMSVWVATVSIAIGLVWATWKFIILETLKQIGERGSK